MKTIHKYALRDAVNQVRTFEGARLLAVANQGEEITLWAEVDPLERETTRTVHVVGTGHDVPDGTYVGTVLVAGGSFVFHVYAEHEAGR